MLFSQSPSPQQEIHKFLFKCSTVGWTFLPLVSTSDFFFFSSLIQWPSGVSLNWSHPLVCPSWEQTFITFQKLCLFKFLCLFGFLFLPVMEFLSFFLMMSDIEIRFKIKQRFKIKWLKYEYLANFWFSIFENNMSAECEWQGRRCARFLQPLN